MRTIKEIKEYWRKKVDDAFVEYIEYMENDLKPYAKLKEYSYQFLKITETNVHTWAFSINRVLTDKEIKKIESIINTYDEGSITRGVIYLGSIYVTTYGDS